MERIKTAKEKVKNFWEEHKEEILIPITAGIAVGGMGLILSKVWQHGFVDGGMHGVDIGIDFLEKNYPGESNARMLMERYNKDHPEEMMYRTKFGNYKKVNK